MGRPRTRPGSHRSDGRSAQRVLVEDPVDLRPDDGEGRLLLSLPLGLDPVEQAERVPGQAVSVWPGGQLAEHLPRDDGVVQVSEQLGDPLESGSPTAHGLTPVSYTHLT